jgi:starvation-inducible DNA-binding protein
MKNHQTVQALEKVLADSYGLLLKTQNYHWNVVGENFKGLHQLFNEQYDEIFAAIDEIAERIRALGSKVDGTFENFSKLSKIKSGNKNADAKTMVKDLAHDNENMIKSLREAIKTAQAEGDEGSADLFIGREKAHEKALWMLESSL